MTTTKIDVDDMVMTAWGIIANAGMKVGTGWESQHPEWVEAAERWRDEMFHPWLDESRADKKAAS